VKPSRESAPEHTRIDSADLDIMRLLEEPSQICEIVDAAHDRQLIDGRRQRRRLTSQ
jgi:hypothetical protein